MRKKQQTAAFVFSGGGVKGISQLGALSVLEDFIKEHNIKVKTVVGTSVGSITASLLSLGIPAKKVISHIKSDNFTLASLTDVSFTGLGLFKAKQLHKAFDHFLGNKTFSKAKCDVFINCVDLYSGKEMVFSKHGFHMRDNNKKPLLRRVRYFDAVRASIAIPFLFEPIKLKNHLLVDGGVLNALALDYIDPANYDLVFVIQTMGSLDYLSEKKPKRNQILVQSFSIIENEFMLPKVYETIKSHGNIVHIRLHNPPTKTTGKKDLIKAIDFGREKTGEEIKSFFGDTSDM